MTLFFTHHARKRAQKRNLSKSRIQSASRSARKYLGRGKYLAKKSAGSRTTSVVFAITKQGKKIITTWRDRA
ncbi:MAG: DUF4258 domain-containing protein [Candidatus Doudnabacteria bacterium]|nr:DUF4258 domain-containing protein [Candidatus Doudnabacteria bacterium]